MISAPLFPLALLFPFFFDRGLTKTDQDLLHPSDPIRLEGKSGKFDFMSDDPEPHRILAAHTGTGTLEIVDVKGQSPVKTVPAGDAQGVAFDLQRRRYFTGNDSRRSITVIDAKTLTVTAEIKVDGPVDAIAVVPKKGFVYAAQDDGKKLWVVDPDRKSIAATIAIPGKPEVLEFDESTSRLYLNIKDTDQIVRIDPERNSIEATWSTLPAKSPHGLAIDAKNSRVFVAGKNGKLVALDLKDGHALAQAEIGEGADQIVYDQERQWVISACKGGLFITDAEGTQLKPLGHVATPSGTHTLAFDAADRSVWISYADASHSYIQKMKMK